MSLINEVEVEPGHKTLWQRSRIVVVALLILAAFGGGLLVGAKSSGAKSRNIADARGQAGMRIKGSDTEHRRSFYFTTEGNEPPEELKEETKRMDAGTQEVDATFTANTETVAIGWGDRYTYTEGLVPVDTQHVHPVFDMNDKRHVLIKISLSEFGATFKLGQENALGLFDETGSQIGYFGDFSEDHIIRVRQVPKRQRPAGVR